jgi:hypothetical protein
MHRFSLACALLLLVGVPAVGRAQVPAAKAAPAAPAGRITIDGVTAWLKAKGLPADPNAEKAYVVTKIGGETYVVFLGDCKDGKCESLQFFYGIKYDGGLKPDEAAAAVIINRWNRDERWIKAYIDQDRDVGLEMDVQPLPANWQAAADPYFDLFKGGVPVFKKWIVDQK